MSTTDITREVAAKVFFATQDLVDITPAHVADATGDISTATARKALAVLTRIGLVYEAAEGSLGTHNGYHWEQGAEAAFDEAWGSYDVRSTDPDRDNSRLSVGLGACYCGCGLTVGGRGKSLYRPGHDARHAALVGRLLAQGDNRLGDLPSDALRDKAERIAHRIANPVKRVRSRKTFPPVWTYGVQAKVGRWVYPARTDGKVAERNTKRDNTGEWVPFDGDLIVPDGDL